MMARERDEDSNMAREMDEDNKMAREMDEDIKMARERDEDSKMARERDEDCKYVKTGSVIKDNNGKLVTDRKDVLEVWEDYFKELIYQRENSEPELPSTV